MTMTRERMSELELQVPNFEGAACAGIGLDIFYEDDLYTERSTVTPIGNREYIRSMSSKPIQHAYLRRMCLECPILDTCREYSIKHERFGFWGGLTAMERHSIRSMKNILLEEITYDVPVTIIRNMDGDDEDEQ
jgi:hypothetical protein